HKVSLPQSRTRSTNSHETLPPLPPGYGLQADSDSARWTDSGSSPPETPRAIRRSSQEMPAPESNRALDARDKTSPRLAEIHSRRSQGAGSSATAEEEGGGASVISIQYSVFSNISNNSNR